MTAAVVRMVGEHTNTLTDARTPLDAEDRRDQTMILTATTMTMTTTIRRRKRTKYFWQHQGNKTQKEKKIKNGRNKEAKNEAKIIFKKTAQLTNQQRNQPGMN